MAIVRWKNRDLYDPWADFKSLQDEINDLFDIDRFPSTTGLFDRSVSPAIDVIEGEHEFTVKCELPGMEQKDIDVSIASNILTIKGQKKNEVEEKKGKYYKKESWAGNFQRTLSLPSSVAADKISAELKDGILTIALPKKEEAKPKQIEVNIK
ncbi:MAG: Hsp20/alpha crystallin family protein [Spirochaetales bacterium]|nr:Hsp20/alpha crystallin family protein [Spirochaetales bacterium]